MAGCDTAFTTTNYGVKTTPHKEFDIATGKQECPEEDMLDREKRKVRVIHKIDALKTLEICKKAGLKDFEILAVVSLSRCAATQQASHSTILWRSGTLCDCFAFFRVGFGRAAGCGGGVGIRQVLYTGPMFQVSGPACPPRSEPLPLCSALCAHPGA
jgi:hypothetical protein